MKNQEFALGIAILLITLLALNGCTDVRPIVPENKSQDTSLSSKSGVVATQVMKKFKDIDELRAFLKESSSAAKMPSFAARDVMLKTSALTAGVEMIQEGAAGTGAQDFSQTNVQYAEVDEADFVKNDNRYIYMIADNKLIIVDAYDAINAEIISETKISDENSDDYSSPMAKELFVLGDKLVLFVEVNEKSFYFEKYDIEPRPGYRQNTLVYVYDISDKSNPSLSEKFSASGSYFQSRMINGIIYLVTQEGVNNWYYVPEPLVKKGVISIKPDIYYFDNPDENYQFNTITSIDLNDGEVVDSKTFMLGYSNTLMVSENNIYIAYQKQLYWRWWNYQRYEKDRFYDVIVPLLKGSLKDDVNAVIRKDVSEEEKWIEISKIFSDFYKNIGQEDEYSFMFEKIADALEEYDTKKALEERKTVIHKISIDGGKLDYWAKGEIYGSLLNQFSLDEKDGYLRVASTVDTWANKRIEYNNVYVLDRDMEIVGELAGIAEDERIYSTRFIGDKLFMVTFKRMDPFFVIDLSDPENPEVLGKLKIPGFSDYLHPYDENHIIGVGKETAENEWGGVSTKGVKIALFDVTDYNEPKLVDKVEIGEAGSDSPVLHDHHAFLFSKTRNLLVLPLTEVTSREKVSNYIYSNQIWNGAYVFHVDESGFEKIGRIRHSSSKSDYFNWWNEATVLRSLYMDKNLYTISNKYIKINDLGNELEELNTVKLPYAQNSPYYWR